MNNTPPSVSVVLLTYNRADLLDGTIDCVLGQTMTDFELIIADNASSDHTQQVCERRALADSRIRYHRRPENLGRTRSINLGILASTGKYVAILHDDDVYAPDLLREWTACLEECPGAGFVFNAYRELDAQGETRAVYREPLPRCSPGSVLLEGIYFKRWRFDSPVFGTAMMRRSAFDRVGPFDERFGPWSDVDMWMRLAEEFEVCYVDKPLMSLRSKKATPRQFDDSFKRVQPLMERMFWEARMRHYRGRPVRRLGEATRHGGFVAASRSWNLAFKIKHGMGL